MLAWILSINARAGAGRVRVYSQVKGGALFIIAFVTAPALCPLMLKSKQCNWNDSFWRHHQITGVSWQHLLLPLKAQKLHAISQNRMNQLCWSDCLWMKQANFQISVSLILLDSNNPGSLLAIDLCAPRRIISLFTKSLGVNPNITFSNHLAKVKESLM